MSPLRPRAGGSARSSLLTVLGEFVLPRTAAGRDQVWTSTLLSAMDALGFTEQNTRVALSRLSDSGVVTRRRQGRRMQWSLTDDGHNLLANGAERIYGFLDPDRPWDGTWLMVLTSIPEHQRSVRRQVQRQLAFLGFRPISGSTFLSSHPERDGDVARMVADLPDGTDISLLRTTATALTTDNMLAARIGESEDLAERYDTFADEFGARAPASARDQFVALTELVDAWRRFPFEDPDLPAALLPPAWPGTSARKVFDTSRASWRSGAVDWFEDVDLASEG